MTANRARASSGGRRPGRRPGNPGTREAIVRAARAAFARQGFTKTTVRGIAAAAGVDPALIHHYFGTKEKLLLATVAVPINPREVVEGLRAGPVETLGVRLASVVMAAWASPAGESLAAALRTAIDDPAQARTIREFLISQVITRVLRQVDCPVDEVDVRAGLIASQLLGVIVGRHIVHFEPLASLPAEVLAPSIGATLQRYLTAPLPSPLPSTSPARSPGPAPSAGPVA